jgi:probable HAF family extracellular repeat protein
VVGHTSVFSSINDHAFRYDGTPGSGGIMRDLGTLSGTHNIAYAQAHGINASGQTAGFSDIIPTTASPTHAFRTTGTPGVAGYVMHDLGTLGGSNSYAYAINDSGQVAGESYKAGDIVQRAFRTTGTPGVAGYVMHDLGTLGGTNSYAGAINASGQVAGSSEMPGDLVGHAFRTTGTPGVGGYVMRDLGSLGGSYINATGINTAGQVVGVGYLPGNAAQHAFIHLGTPTASMIDLDAWLDANNPTEGAKWTLTRAQGLNDSLLIVGTGEYDANADGIFDVATDGSRAFVLDASGVVPEPGSLATLAVGSLALLRRRPHRHHRGDVSQLKQFNKGRVHERHHRTA